MPKSISWRKLVKKFRNLGFDGPYSGGRHLFMVRGNLKIHIPKIGNCFSIFLVPKGVPMFYEAKQVRESACQADISPDEWDDE